MTVGRLQASCSMVAFDTVGWDVDILDLGRRRTELDMQLTISWFGTSLYLIWSLIAEKSSLQSHCVLQWSTDCIFRTSNKADFSVSDLAVILGTLDDNSQIRIPPLHKHLPAWFLIRRHDWAMFQGCVAIRWEGFGIYARALITLIDWLTGKKFCTFALHICLRRIMCFDV